MAGPFMFMIKLRSFLPLYSDIFYKKRKESILGNKEVIKRAERLDFMFFFKRFHRRF